MKWETVIEEFAKKHYKLLKTKENFDWERYRELKRAYFADKLPKSFGIPKDSEICDCFVKVIIKNDRLFDLDALEELATNLPFLKMYNTKADDYRGFIESISGTYAIKDELHDLKDFERIKRLTERIREQETKNIDELKKQKEEEYRRLPSILDDVDYVEPDEEPKTTEKREWWEELNLRENPFPGPLDGFSLIDKSLHGEIIVLNPPLQWALNKIEKNEIDIFHKGFLLDGEFGTGKTTFFDFLSPHLIIKHIEPIRVALTETINAAHYVQKFEKEICREMRKLAKKYGIPLSNPLIDFDEAQLIMIAIQEKGIKGFFIFVDDLHKHINSENVFNFLANLQITKNTFTREEINAVFVVSGLPIWRDRIKQDSALSGFFDAPEELTLPQVTPEIAAQAIKKRLQAYAINPEKELSVKEEFLKTIFRKFSSNVGRSNIGYRYYIQEAVNSFSEGKYDILSVDFTRLDEKIVQSVRLVLESNDDFKKSIDKLVFGGGIKKKENMERILKILCEIYLRKGVNEAEELFNQNKFAFKRLCETGLIQKYEREGNLVWKLSSILAGLNKEIISQFSLSLEDYIVPIYSIPSPRVKEQEKIELSKIDQYRQDMDGWKSDLDNSIIQNLQLALKTYEEYIFPFIEKETRKFSEKTLPSKDAIKDCIWTMMKCIIRFESPSLLNVCGETNILGWTIRHRSLEYSPHFIKLYDSLVQGTSEKSDIVRLISFAHDAFDELWEEFKKTLKVYKSSQTKCFLIPKRILNDVYLAYDKLIFVTQSKEEYFEAFSDFVKTIEDAIRKYLHISTLLILGPNRAGFRHYPDFIKKYITQNISTAASSYESYNEFENLNRGQYRQLFTGDLNSEFYRLIIAPIIKTWATQDISAFFQLFGDANILESHNKISHVEEFKKNMPTFFYLSCRLISSFSERLIDLVTKINTIVQYDSKTYVLFGWQCKKHGEIEKLIEMDNLNDIPPYIYKQHEITNVLKTHSVDKLKEYVDNLFDEVELDIQDVEGTSVKFGVEFAQFTALVAYYLSTNKLRLINLYGTNVYLKKI